MGDGFELTSVSREPVPMHSQQPPGVVQNWSTLQCSKQNTEQCGYDHALVTRGRMRAQFPLPHGPADTEDTVPRFYCPETILHDPEAMEDLETSLKSIKSTRDQWWEEALSCIQKKAINHQRQHKNKKQ